MAVHRIALINPNTSAVMTESMATVARSVADADVVIEAWTAPVGPAAIESHVDEAFAAVSVVEFVRENRGFDAYIISCASDPGLFAARELVDAPVLGIGEAAYHLAGMLGRRFLLVTTLARDVTGSMERVEALGLGALCGSVIASDVPVLETGHDNAEGVERIIDVARHALNASNCEVVVLGCGGMADSVNAISTALGVPVVDGVTAAVVMAQGLIRCGLRTSKAASFAPPVEIPYTGMVSPSTVVGSTTHSDR